MASWCIIFIVVLATIVTISARSHDLTEGARLPGDEQAVKEHVKFNRRLLKNRRETKTYTVEGFITYIRILDNHREDGATPRIVGGGVGNNFVNIDFKSQKNHGIDFDIEIYKTNKWEK